MHRTYSEKWKKCGRGRVLGDWRRNNYYSNGEHTMVHFQWLRLDSASCFSWFKSSSLQSCMISKTPASFKGTICFPVVRIKGERRAVNSFGTQAHTQWYHRFIIFISSIPRLFFPCSLLYGLKLLVIVQVLQKASYNLSSLACLTLYVQLCLHEARVPTLYCLIWPQIFLPSKLSVYMEGISWGKGMVTTDQVFSPDNQPGGCDEAPIVGLSVPIWDRQSPETFLKAESVSTVRD